MAAAVWKFDIAQVAHSEDAEYHPDLHELPRRRAGNYLDPDLGPPGRP
jgi:hypothetical protein